MFENPRASPDPSPNNFAPPIYNSWLRPWFDVYYICCLYKLILWTVWFLLQNITVQFPWLLTFDFFQKVVDMDNYRLWWGWQKGKGGDEGDSHRTVHQSDGDSHRTVHQSDGDSHRTVHQSDDGQRTETLSLRRRCRQSGFHTCLN